MIRHRLLFTYLLTIAIGLIFGANLLAEDKPPRKYALLVGVKKYIPGELETLNYTENDVEELAKVLKGLGFERVVVLTQTRGATQPELSPTSDNIADHVKSMLEDCRAGDWMVVGFSGHGFHLKVGQSDESYFCPADARPSKQKNMIALSELYKQLASGPVGVKLLLVDACRNQLNGKGGGRDDFQASEPPRGVVGLFSCSRDQKSFESDEFKHGVFFHYVIEGLKGQAANKSGEVTLNGLEEYLADEVPRRVKQETSPLVRQIPSRVGDFSGKLVLAKAAAKPLASDSSMARAKESNSAPKIESGVGKDLTKAGEVREFEIVSGVKMKFCWIPPGEAQLGSSKEELDYVTKTYFDVYRPDWLDYESESNRGKYASKGFWLGKFAVTQQEWQAVMGSNPSFFSKNGDGHEKVAGMDTSRFPAERVSWDDCGIFLEKLNNRGEAEKVFGKRGKFVLPHEDEWEFACRGGRGNKRPFYFGDALNGRQANCDGTAPYGTNVKGPNIGRPTNVGSQESEAPHPWGLCDMHGNVAQWCENWYSSEQKYRVIRGGSWGSIPANCRAANRVRSEPDKRYDSTGFRVCFRSD